MNYEELSAWADQQYGKKTGGGEAKASTPPTPTAPTAPAESYSGAFDETVDKAGNTLGALVDMANPVRQSGRQRTNLAGLGRMALSTVASPFAGLAGLGALVTSLGDTDVAARAVRAVADYVPNMIPGEESDAERVIGSLGETAGAAGELLGGNTGRLLAELGTGALPIKGKTYMKAAEQRRTDLESARSKISPESERRAAASEEEYAANQAAQDYRTQAASTYGAQGTRLTGDIGVGAENAKARAGTIYGSTFRDMTEGEQVQHIRDLQRRASKGDLEAQQNLEGWKDTGVMMYNADKIADMRSSDTRFRATKNQVKKAVDNPVTREIFRGDKKALNTYLNDPTKYAADRKAPQGMLNVMPFIGPLQVRLGDMITTRGRDKDVKRKLALDEVLEEYAAASDFKRLPVASALIAEKSEDDERRNKK